MFCNLFPSRSPDQARAPFSQKLGLCSAILLIFVSPAFAKAHIHYGDGFSADVDDSYAMVWKVVEAATEDGIVRGTSEYKGTAELYGAGAAKSSDAIKKPAPPGSVIYKVRTETIAPEHFENSNDQGIVVIRYVVQELGPKSTRITIDSVFVENSHHHTHLSDGTVENAEFLAISDNLKSLEEEQAKRLRDAAFAKQQEKLETLQSTLEDEERQLKAVMAKQQELQNKLQQTHAGKQARVKVAAVDLKSQPYTDAKTLQSLASGDSVTILWQTRSWFQVQTADGTTGWVYALLLEPQR
jgi:hypothetical protein